MFRNLVFPLYLVIYCARAARLILSSYYFWQVGQACFALSSLASDVSIAMQLMKADIMQPIKTVLKSVAQDEVISVLQVVAKLAFTSDTVSQKMCTKDLLKSLKLLCAQKNPEASLRTLHTTKTRLLLSTLLFVILTIFFCRCKGQLY